MVRRRGGTMARWRAQCGLESHSPTAAHCPQKDDLSLQDDFTRDHTLAKHMPHDSLHDARMKCGLPMHSPAAAHSAQRSSSSRQLELPPNNLPMLLLLRATSSTLRTARFAGAVVGATAIKSEVDKADTTRPMPRRLVSRHRLGAWPGHCSPLLIVGSTGAAGRKGACRCGFRICGDSLCVCTPCGWVENYVRRKTAVVTTSLLSFASASRARARVVLAPRLRRLQLRAPADVHLKSGSLSGAA